MLSIEINVLVDSEIIRPAGREYQQARLAVGEHDYRIAFTGQVRYVVPDDPDACWEWLQSESFGYAYIGVRVDGRLVRHRANRWFYDRYVGPLEDNQHVHHRCENKLCVNPRHLKLKDGSLHIRDHKTGLKMVLSDEERERRRQHGIVMAERNFAGRWRSMSDEERSEQLRKMQEGRYAKT